MTIELSLLVLRCQDLDASRAFYEELGLTFTQERHGTGPVHYSTSLGSTVLELYPSSGVATPLRFGLRTQNLAQLAGAFSSAIVRIDDASQPSVVLLKDPDGNMVEVTGAGSSGQTVLDGEPS